MTEVRILTAQNVEISYQPASIGERIAAELIDVAVKIVWVLIFVFLQSFFPSDAVRGWVMLVWSIPVLFYNLAFDILFNGQTIGKMAMRTRVIKLDGTKPNIGSYSLRWLLRLVDMMLGYGGVALITIAINGKGQRLGDIAAGTTVIKIKSDTQLSDTPILDVDHNYTVKYPDVLKLSDRDVTIIKGIFDKSMEGYRPEMLDPLVEKIETLTGIKNETDNYSFVYTILKDYNHLAGKL